MVAAIKTRLRRVHLHLARSRRLTRRANGLQGTNEGKRSCGRRDGAALLGSGGCARCARLDRNGGRAKADASVDARAVARSASGAIGVGRVALAPSTTFRVVRGPRRLTREASRTGRRVAFRLARDRGGARGACGRQRARRVTPLASPQARVAPQASEEVLSSWG